jgi:hypothetical protein
MRSTKAVLILALAIGAVISSVLLALEPLTNYAFLSWEGPGITAAYLYWGAMGSSVVMGIAISLIVNTLAYGLAAFVLLSVIRAFRRN